MAKILLAVGAVLILFIGDAFTFKWYDGVIPEKVNITEENRKLNPTIHWGEQTDLYKEVKGNFTLGATNFSSEYSDSIAWTRTAGFVDTIFYAYRQHHNVIIRPDDIWTAIVVQFSLYVNANAEALRHSFVNFEGKQTLKVEFRSRIHQVDMRDFIQAIMNLIDENIKPSVYNWILPNFTTTTENDKLTTGVAMMATLQNFFDYEFWGIICGIPEVTILGTVEDWREIRARVDGLKDFEVEGKTTMAHWSFMLGQILDHFVSVKEGKTADDVFWRQAIRVDYKVFDVVCAKINETYVNGWITTFSAFTLNGRFRGDNDVKQNGSYPWFQIRVDKITPGVVHVPIKIHDEFAKEGQRDYTGTIITGSMGYSVKRDEKTLQPFSGWIMAITNDLPDYVNAIKKSRKNRL